VAASGITDDALLDKLVALNLHGETLAALSLDPLVMVAWADGHIDKGERIALLSAASGGGCTKTKRVINCLNSGSSIHLRSTCLPSGRITFRRCRQH
jgi:hypothetical protein